MMFSLTVQLRNNINILPNPNENSSNVHHNYPNISNSPKEKHQNFTFDKLIRTCFKIS